MENNSQDTKNQILSDIQIVINGCSNDIHLSNKFSSWKNTAKGLSVIKEDQSNFNLGINLWIQITQDQILGISDIEDLKVLQNNGFSWIENFINVKKYNS